MPKRKEVAKDARGVGRPRSAKVGVWARIDPGDLTSLDQVAEGMRPIPTRAALIALAVQEFVERWRAKKN